MQTEFRRLVRVFTVIHRITFQNKKNDFQQVSISNVNVNGQGEVDIWVNELDIFFTEAIWR